MNEDVLALEQELFFVKEQLTEAEEIAKLGHWIYDTEDGQFWWSEQVNKIFVISGESQYCSIEQFVSFIDDKDKLSFMENLFHATDSGQDFSLEFQTIPINGIPKFLYSQWKCRLDENNKVYQLFGIFQDITDRRIIEEVLKRETLKAGQANRSKSIFLSNMSHEIRTPMNAILGFTEILYNEIEDDSHRHYLETILNSGRSLLKIINDILDLSKVESGKLTLEDGYFNLRDLINDVLMTFTLNAQAKGIELICEISKDFPKQVKLDKVRIRQILINLFGNALKFTDQGAITIKVENPKNNILRISVIDTGVGIEDSQQGKVFEEFEQTKGQSFEKYGGTGLGLSISRKIVALMGGKISLKSKLGQGSSFIIEIPDVSFNDDEAIKDTYNMITSDLSSKNILIVDSTLESKTLYQGFLKYTNAKLHFVQSCSEVDNYTRTGSIDLVLIDKKGISSEEIKEIPFTDKDYNGLKPKLVLCSASTAQEEQELSMLYDTHLFKPISQAGLVGCFNELFDVKAEKAIVENVKVHRVICFPKDIQQKFIDFLDGLIVDELQELIDKVLPLYQDNTFVNDWCEELSTALSIFDIEQVENLIQEIEVQ
ncbi:MAG: hypothetical protein KC646_11225 [Candidatus Cloacimonetes bacterium]|nr:hypothetical protein [Candidatus Cloacimonadota bacterium]